MVSSIHDKSNIGGNKSETRGNQQTEQKPKSPDDRQVFGVIGPQGLKQAPETMTDVNRSHNDRHGIKNNIGQGFECRSHGLKHGLPVMVDKMKIREMNGDKGQDDEAGIRHGHRSDGAAPTIFFDLVAHRPGLPVLPDKETAGGHMDDGKKKQPGFRHPDQGAQGVKVLHIGLKQLFPAIQGQVADQMDEEKETKT